MPPKDSPQVNQHLWADNYRRQPVRDVSQVDTNPFPPFNYLLKQFPDDLAAKIRSTSLSGTAICPWIPKVSHNSRVRRANTDLVFFELKSFGSSSA